MSRQTRSPLRLLVPLDGSPLAEQAIPYARMLGRLFPAHIHLLRVVAPGLIDRLVHLEAVMLGAAGDELGTRGEQDERMRDALRDDGTRYLKAHAAELDVHAKRVTHELVFGLPAEQIVASATRQGSDLIVMSTHGVGGMLRWALGSVSAQVLRSGTQPVLLVRGVETPPEVVAAPRRLLVALDGSPTTERILPLATRIAHAAHAELLLVQVSMVRVPERILGVGSISLCRSIHPLCRTQGLSNVRDDVTLVLRLIAPHDITRKLTCNNYKCKAFFGKLAHMGHCYWRLVQRNGSSSLSVVEASTQRYTLL